MDDIDFSKAKPRGPFTGGLAAKEGDFMERAEFKGLVEEKILQFILKDDEGRLKVSLPELKAVVSLAVNGTIDPKDVGVKNFTKLVEKASDLKLTDGRGRVSNKRVKHSIGDVLEFGISKGEISLNGEDLKLPSSLLKSLANTMQEMYSVAKAKAGQEQNTAIRRK